MNVNVVNDHIADVLQRDASTADNVDVRPAAVQGLVAVEDELLGQPYQHVPREHDPQWLLLYDGIAQRPRLRVHRVIIRGISDNVHLTIPAADGILPEPHGTVGEPLPVVGPIWVALPAVVDGISCLARGRLVVLGELEHLSPPR